MTRHRAIRRLTSARMNRRAGPARGAISAAAVAVLSLVGLVASPGAAWAGGAVVGPGGMGIIGGDRLAAAGEVVDTSPSVPPLPAITATSFVVADADTGAVLAAKNAHLRLAPASTLKTLTALTLIPRLPPSTMTVAGRDAPNVDGTKAGIVAGMHYSAGDLFTAMLMMSANDAAVALADANGGLDKTLAQMNAEAAHLNAYDTVAKTPNGLDAPGQSSSAYDLALFFRAGLNDARFRHYLALKRAPFPAPGGTTFQIQTHDRLLNTYPGMVGGKNGYTVAAQASYVGAASRGGRTIIVAVMRDQPNFWAEVKQLFDWGFAADQVADPVGALVPAGTLGSQRAASTGALGARPDGVASSVAPGRAGAGAGRGTAEGRSASGAAPSGGAGLSSVLTWTAVGIGGLVLLLALGQASARRRRRREDDRHYLANLSRLSGAAKFRDPN